MNLEDRIKLFRFSHEMAERDLDRVEAGHSLDLGRTDAEANDKDEDYYPQFSLAVRDEAARMGSHYELFYCLEKSIRSLIVEKLKEAFGAKWWASNVPTGVQAAAANNIQRERDSGVTPRSTEEIDYTTFGELGEIVRSNWATFVDTFNSEKAFTKVMTNLNTLRGPIAHCSPLAEDEVVRLRLSVRDWFRLME